MNDILDLFGVGDDSTTPASILSAQVDTAPPKHPSLRMLDCGHMDWFAASANEEALVAGFCCEGGRKKLPVSWWDLRGRYVRPIPVHMRRTEDKERGPGFPGLCTDHEGYYIGGVANDCRRSSDDRRCVVHGGVLPSVVVTEPASVDVRVDTLPNPSGMSWKQRQYAKRGKK